MRGRVGAQQEAHHALPGEGAEEVRAQGTPLLPRGLRHRRGLRARRGGRAGLSGKLCSRWHLLFCPHFMNVGRSTSEAVMSNCEWHEMRIRMRPIKFKIVHMLFILQKFKYSKQFDAIWKHIQGTPRGLPQIQGLYGCYIGPELSVTAKPPVDNSWQSELEPMFHFRHTPNHCHLSGPDIFSHFGFSLAVVQLLSDLTCLAKS